MFLTTNFKVKKHNIFPELFFPPYVFQQTVESVQEQIYFNYLVLPELLSQNNL